MSNRCVCNLIFAFWNLSIEIWNLYIYTMQYLLPSFFIIGERKCGTSSLYRYLVAHPNVLPCKVKEPHFFTKPLWKMILGFKKYKSLFPVVKGDGDLEFEWPELDENGELFTEIIKIDRKEGMPYITGEASVNTFFYANPKIVRRFLPKVKIILMLREPVERTFSHYRMLQRFKKEGRKTMSITDFSNDMQREMQRVKKGQKSAVLSPSIYVEQLPKWLDVFGRDNIFIIKSEDLNEEKKAHSLMQQLFEFLNLPPCDLGEMLNKKYNAAPKKSMPKAIEKEMKIFFEPYNLELQRMLGQKDFLIW